jgi:hypothetical protein
MIVTTNGTNITIPSSSNYIINQGVTAGWNTTTYKAYVLNKNFQYIRECFPISWNIVYMKRENDSLTIETNSENSKEELHKDMIANMSTFSIVWTPESVKSCFTFYIPLIDFEKVHKEMFEKQFIEDFESVEV